MGISLQQISNHSQAQTLKNIAAVLEAAGSDFTKIVKLNVYLKSYSDFVEMNEVYITHFGEVKPVSTTWFLTLCLGSSGQLERPKKRGEKVEELDNKKLMLHVAWNNISLWPKNLFAPRQGRVLRCWICRLVQLLRWSVSRCVQEPRASFSLYLLLRLFGALCHNRVGLWRTVFKRLSVRIGNRW